MEAHYMRSGAATFAALAMLAGTAGAEPPATPIGELRRGTTVTVTGTVARITDDDTFRLSDATGSVLVYVGPNPVPAETGERVTVNGTVDDDPGPLEIYARRLIRANGQDVLFEYRYD
jgi:uncharacterized protein YdeI (BOF family)